jgi:dCTP deaminase
MPLSDVEIWNELAAGKLSITPPPTSERVSASSIDLLLHPELRVMAGKADCSGITVDPRATKIMDLLGRFSKRETCTRGFKLHSGMFVIGKTLEVIKLPPNMAARIEGKSSLARLGLGVHITAPTVIAGFEGRLVLEMINHGPFTIELTEEMPIAQLILEWLGSSSEGYHGQYQGQN